MSRIENYTSINSEKKEHIPSIILDFGDASSRGKRWEMEDAHTVKPKFRGEINEFFAGVYDGHNGRGAADLSANRLHLNLAKLLAKKSPEEALKEAFKLTDDEVAKTGMEDGTTAVVAYLNGVDLYVANAGDARAVLGRGNTIKRLSHDHKASDPIEKRRIEKLGGTITSRYETGVARVNGILAIARSIGDHREELEGFISVEPYVTHTKLEPGDHTLILACDGIWDVFSDKKAIDFIKDIPDAKNAAIKLKDEAIIGRGSRDNVTAIVVKLSIPLSTK